MENGVSREEQINRSITQENSDINSSLNVESQIRSTLSRMTDNSDDEQYTSESIGRKRRRATCASNTSKMLDLEMQNAQAQYDQNKQFLSLFERYVNSMERIAIIKEFKYSAYCQVNHIEREHLPSNSRDSLECNDLNIYSQ